MTTLYVPAFVVIGGGALGTASARQLLRARAMGRLATDRIVVVDRDPACTARGLPPPVEVAVGAWPVWLSRNLGRFRPGDHFVPDHWAPHLLREWLVGEVAAAGGRVEPSPVLESRGLPYEMTTRAGDRAFSYATWPCPPRCIEPALCPHTRGAKDWSLARDLAGPGPAPDGIDEAIVFSCLHLVFGIGTVPVADILGARDRMLRNLGGGRRRYLIATSSHCHALAAAVDVSPVASAVNASREPR